MDVIDVTRQSNIRMKLRDFVEYFNTPCRTRILNVISLEFTNTGYINIHYLAVHIIISILILYFFKQFVNLNTVNIAVSRH